MSSNSTPITLQSLQPYAAHQEELIEALLARDTQNFRFREPEEAWTPFWESVWGKDLKFEKEQVVRDPHPISDSLILPDVVPPHCVLLPKPKTLDDCWKGFQLKKIFIRHEFKEAEEFVLSIFGEAKMYYDAVTVTGQPEIGKSAFLLLILLQRLALKLPTVLQVGLQAPVLFYRSGVKELGQPDDGAAYNSFMSRDDSLRRIWAITDTSRDLHNLASALRVGPFFLVEAVSPRSLWMDGSRTDVFYMKPWPFSEILQVRPLISTLPSEEQLWYLHIMYGPLLRNLFLYAERPDIYDGMVTSEINNLSPYELSRIYRSPHKAADHSHFLVTTGPSPARRSRAERKIVSSHVLELFCRLILEDRVDLIGDFYRTLRIPGATASSAGMVFKHRLHHFLKEGRTLNLFPIIASSRPQGTTHFKYVYSQYTDGIGLAGQQVTLPVLEERLVDSETQRTHDPWVYYRPRITNFTAVDSWIVLPLLDPNAPPIVLAFQMTINATEHEAKPAGLERLLELIPKDAVVYHVIATSEEAKPKIEVSADYLSPGFLGGRDVNEAFPVFHCKINSVELFMPPFLAAAST